MFKVAAIGIALAISAGIVTCARAAEGDIRLADGTVVPTPADGFKWTARKPEPGATEKLEIFIAAKEGSFSKVMLIANPISQDADEKRTKTLANAVAGNVDSIKSQGFTEIKIDVPKPDKPIGERLSFAITGTARNGKTHYFFYTTIVFGKKTTCQFQAISRSQEEAQSLIKVVDVMKE
jgi:hypothetical protein